MPPATPEPVLTGQYSTMIGSIFQSKTAPEESFSTCALSPIISKCSTGLPLASPHGLDHARPTLPSILKKTPPIPVAGLAVGIFCVR
jgi:hypothetical protein